MIDNKIAHYGGGLCDCFETRHANETTAGNVTECILAGIFSPCYYGKAMRLALDRNEFIWGLGCLLCGPCGLAATGENFVNEDLGGADMCLEFGVDYICCCCCLHTCGTARFYRAVRRQYKDNNGDGVGDTIHAPAPMSMSRKNYLDERSDSVDVTPDVSKNEEVPQLQTKKELVKKASRTWGEWWTSWFDDYPKSKEEELK